MDNRIPQFRNRAHWTPKYIRDRIALMITDALHPDWPMLTKDAIKWLDKHLTKDMIGVEFGGGRSTLWLAKRLNKLASVEHDPRWVRQAANVLNIVTNNFLGVIDLKPDQKIDFCLIDGLDRDKCAYIMTDKLKSGGILVVDDIERYWNECEWVPFFKVVEKWERIVTTNGIRDTAIWIKP